MSVSVRPQRFQRGRVSQLGFIPFAESPSSEFYFPSGTHEEVLARLSYQVEEHDRCGLLFGAPGSGKSLTLQRLKQLLNRSGWNVSLIDLAGLDAPSLLYQLAAGLGTNPDVHSDAIDLWERVEQAIQASSQLRQPRVLLLDHVDRLRPGTVSLVEHLLNLPYPHGLVTLFAGCRDSTPLMKAICERTGLRVELSPLTTEESSRYIEESLQLAHVTSCQFTRDALQLVGRISRGNPRRINRLCRTALLAAKTDYRAEIDSELVLAVAEELLDAEVLAGAF